MKAQLRGLFPVGVTPFDEQGMLAYYSPTL